MTRTRSNRGPLLNLLSYGGNSIGCKKSNQGTTREPIHQPKCAQEWWRLQLAGRGISFVRRGFPIHRTVVAETRTRAESECHLDMAQSNRDLERGGLPAPPFGDWEKEGRGNNQCLAITTLLALDPCPIQQRDTSRRPLLRRCSLMRSRASLTMRVVAPVCRQASDEARSPLPPAAWVL